MSGKTKKSFVGSNNNKSILSKTKEETMLGKIRKAAVLAAMLGVGFGVTGSTANAVDYEIIGTDQLKAPNTSIGDANGSHDTVISTANATYTQNADITIGGSGSLTFGHNGTIASPNKVDVSLVDAGGGGANNGKLTVNNGALTIATGASTGTNVTASHLVLGSNAASITLNSNSLTNSPNILSVGSVSSSTTATNNIMRGTMTIGGNSIFRVTSGIETVLGSIQSLTLNLNGGEADFKNTASGTGFATLKNGTISGSGTVRGNIDVDGVDAKVSITGGKTQVYTDDFTHTQGVFEVKGGAGGHAIADIKGTLTADASTGFDISGASSGAQGFVYASNLSMTAPNNGVINVGNWGNLDIGKDNTNSTSSLANGEIKVADNGTVNFRNKVNMVDSNTLNNAGKTTYHNTVAMGTGNTLTTTLGGVTTFKDAVTTQTLGNNNIVADKGLVAFEKAITLKDGNYLTLKDGGVIDYSAIAEGLVITEDDGTIIAQGDGNIFKTTGLTGSKENAVTIQTSGTTNGSLELSLGKDGGAPYGEYVADAEKSINFNSQKGTFTVGDMIITENVDGEIYNNVGAGSAMNVMGGLTVDEGAVAKGNADISTTVNGKSYIDGEYYLSGDDNYFNDDITVSGTLGVDISPATLVQKGETTLYVADGGTLGTDTKTLNIEGLPGAKQGDLGLEFLGGKTVTNTVLGTVNADLSDTLVKSNLNLDGDLTVYSYKQTAGEVLGNGSLTVLDDKNAAVISGAGSVFGVTADFAGDLKVLSGASLLGADKTITGHSSTLTVDGASMIDLTEGSLKLTGFKEVNVKEGTILVGYDPNQPNQLDLDPGKATHITAGDDTIKFTGDFFQQYYENGTSTTPAFIIKNGEINDGKLGVWDKSTAFGDFTIIYNDFDGEGAGAYLSDYEKRDVEDQGAMHDYLANMFGSGNFITNGMSGGLSGVAQNILNSNTGIKHDGSLGGQANYGIFEAIANGNSTWEFTDSETGKQYSGSVDNGLVMAMNGANQSNMMYIGQDSIRNVQDVLGSRLDAFRAVKEITVNECFASDTALGSADIMNARYLNRIWAGALGTWQNANERHGFEGYKYKAAGGIVGYDRAFGPAIVGVSFSYIDGDYEDKNFSWNDSKIRQHNVNLYGTYSASSGFFATVMGGYNYQKNKLKYGSGLNRFYEDSETNTLYASGKLGYDVMPCDNFSISPSVGVNYFYSRTGEHNVHMSNIDDASLLKYDSMTNHHIELPVEVKVAYEIPFSEKAGLTLQAKGGYAYNFNDKEARGNVLFRGFQDAVSDQAVNLSSRAKGRKLGHNSWTAGAGAKFRYDNWEVGVNYDYYGRSSYHSHQVTGAIGYSF